MLQIEFGDEAQQEAGHSCQELYRQLEGFGYRMYTFDPLYHRLVPEVLREAYPFADIYAVKRLRDVEDRLSIRP